MVAIGHSYVSKNSYGNKQQENSCGSYSSEDDVMVVAILGRLAGGRKNRSCGIIILYHLESWPWAGYLLVHQHG